MEGSFGKDDLATRIEKSARELESIGEKLAELHEHARANQEGIDKLLLAMARVARLLPKP